jgi:hypothetical protein
MTAQVGLRHWPGVRLSWVGNGVVVHSGSEPGSRAAAVVASWAPADELCVVVNSHTVRLLPAMVDELADVLALRLPPGCAAIRLVAWDGACSHNDRPAPAYLLAARLGIEVIAPAGPLLGVPGRSLFAPPARGPQRRGGWWRFRAGTVPALVGWRFPAPRWEIDLNAVGEVPRGLVLDQVPAGIWLHRPGHRSVTDLVFSVPVDPADPALILSHPSEPALHADDLRRAANALPPRAVERVILTPYGQRPVAEGSVGEVAAAVLGKTVRVRTGLPLCAAAGQRAVVAIDDRGLPRWRPFAREVQYTPRTIAPSVVDWANPAPSLLAEPTGLATFALDAGWVVEAIEAGLWLRPVHPLESASWIRALPLDVDRCTVVVGAPHVSDPAPSDLLVTALLKQLPADARARLRLAVPRGVTAQVLQLAAAVCTQLPGDSEVELLAADDRRPTVVTQPVLPQPLGVQSTGLPTTAFQPTALHPIVPRPLMSQPGAHEPVVPQPFEPQPFEPQPLVPEPALPQPPDLYPSGLQPLVPEPALPQPPDLYPSGPQPVLPPRPADLHPADLYPSDLYPSDLYPSDLHPSDLYSSGPQPMIPPGGPLPTNPVHTNPVHSGPAPVVPAPAGPEPVPAASVSAPTGHQAGPDSDESATGQHKVRSHRNAGKPTRDHDEENPADAEELDRLLGFFDEIRRAKAWDESPNWTAENAKPVRPPAADHPKVPAPRFGDR